MQTVRSQIRPILGSNVQHHDLRKTAFPIAQPMTTAVRAPKTFRRLAASETLNDSGQAAIKPEPKKADIPQRPARIILGCGSGLDPRKQRAGRSEEQTSELQSQMCISYAVFCLKKTK